MKHLRALFRFGRFRLLLAAALAVAVVGGALSVLGVIGSEDVAKTCAPGFVPIPEAVKEIAKEVSAEAVEGKEAEEEFRHEVAKELPMLAGLPRKDWAEYCVPKKRPESLGELSRLAAEQAIPRVAPYGTYKPGAFRSGVKERRQMRPGSVHGTSGTGAPYGNGPLIVNDPRYDEVNGLGLAYNSGRVDSFAHDPVRDRLFAAVGTGGIWMSTDKAQTWTDATGNLPTTITGTVAWTAAGGGTLLALTGEPTFGAYAYTGIGAYYSTDLGNTWTRASGVPDGALGFALAVDQADPSRVYAATQLGLFASTDGGRSYANAKLPTGDCAGMTDVAAKPKCALANVVTDVVVVTPGGLHTSAHAGAVVATVGWRGGTKKNPDGSVQSKNNGIYRSPSGTPNTFTKLAVTGFAPPDRIGRVELGTTTGEKQDHDVLYAIVQDAKLLNNGGVIGFDVPESGPKPPVGTTVLNGLYVSNDFGLTWTQLATGTELASDPTTGSALFAYGTAVGYQPGVQGWYNLWISPDPTRQTSSGAPTRLVFGLEEMWANEAVPGGVPLDGTVPVKFHVVGKYFAGSSCQLLRLGAVCPTDREPTDDNYTTHPDQHDGIWIPDASVGGVQLVVGNDGGTYRYRFDTDADGELDNAHWGLGDNDGFETLLPYFASMARDGTAWAGLQDNGTMRIAPPDSELVAERGKRFETNGGDGFYTAVDPDNSRIAYGEYTFAAMSVTTDGGETWLSIDPELTASKFSNPFAMDPLDAKHLITAGREVVETVHGHETAPGHSGEGNSWATVFDLGTRTRPGVAEASASDGDPHNSMSAVDVVGDAAYVGFCGQCDTLNMLGPAGLPVFQNGLATNVGGSEAPEKGTNKGWHIADAKGLPNRYITSVAIDRADPKTVFVTLGGYTRRWLPPGAVGDVNAQVGTGHLYRSTDGGASFADVSGNLPDVPATWVELRGGQLLIGTDAGAFASGLDAASLDTPKFAPLKDLPAVPIRSIQLKPGDPDTAVVAAYGRGVWTYHFDKDVTLPKGPTQEPAGDPAATPTANSPEETSAMPTSSSATNPRHTGASRQTTETSAPKETSVAAAHPPTRTSNDVNAEPPTSVDASPAGWGQPLVIIPLFAIVIGGALMVLRFLLRAARRSRNTGL